MNAGASGKVYLRRGEARELLGVSRQVFAKLVGAGTLTPKYFMTGGRAFFERTQVEGCKPRARTAETATTKHL